MIKIINEHFPGIFEFYFNRFINKQIINDFIPNGYLYFKDVNEIDIWGNDYIDYFNVKADEYYVCFPNKKEHLPYGVFERYVGYDSTKINNFLRSNLKSSENESILNQIEVLKHEIERLNKTDLWTYWLINQLHYECYFGIKIYALKELDTSNGYADFVIEQALNWLHDCKVDIVFEGKPAPDYYAIPFEAKEKITLLEDELSPLDAFCVLMHRYQSYSMLKCPAFDEF